MDDSTIFRSRRSGQTNNDKNQDLKKKLQVLEQLNIRPAITVYKQEAE